MEPQWISPKYKKTDFSFPLTFDDKVNIFANRIKGWQLQIAKQCLADVPHSGFGALYICLSYFEMIARFRAGDITIDNAGYFFKQGFRQFTSNLPIAAHPHLATIANLLYKGARCGLYHISTTAKRVYISGLRQDALTYDATLLRLTINPHILINEILADFGGYISQLSNPTEQILRQKFEQKFNHDILPQIT